MFRRAIILLQQVPFPVYKLFAYKINHSFTNSAEKHGELYVYLFFYIVLYKNNIFVFLIINFIDKRKCKQTHTNFLFKMFTMYTFLSENLFHE